MKLERIRVVPGVCEGKPTIRGLRITVELVLKLLAEGLDIEAILLAYPELEREDVLESIRYAAWLASGRDSAVA